jgi:hypothetical protein
VQDRNGTLTKEEVAAAIQLVAEELQAKGNRQLILSGIVRIFPEYIEPARAYLHDIEEEMSAKHGRVVAGSFADGFSQLAW